MFGKLGGLGNMAALASNFGEIQKRIKEVHRKTGEMIVTGSAGEGAVEVDVTGHGEMVACRIAPALLSGPENVAQLQSLVIEASNDAGKKAKAAAKEMISREAEDLNVPGLGDMLAKVGM
ncbi:YbaB/EbfC family nucleoid-associated protein [Alienimonas californiensis]|uniref:Nucleoid-associated protein CA12_28400 n=1 Tax=Alienimonas californiensis TaxID=2527989 RepID=A0A517PBG7_9PLAN|nr:YbaB/EbfC family nucleoid-associated protein [Alienimonas californiensis]QDT16734.1 Nucleoid-associated protein [Alienimonas californiensis]